MSWFQITVNQGIILKKSFLALWRKSRCPKGAIRIMCPLQDGYTVQGKGISLQVSLHRLPTLHNHIQGSVNIWITRYLWLLHINGTPLSSCFHQWNTELIAFIAHFFREHPSYSFILLHRMGTQHCSELPGWLCCRKCLSYVVRCICMGLSYHNRHYPSASGGLSQNFSFAGIGLWLAW